MLETHVGYRARRCRHVLGGQGAYCDEKTDAYLLISESVPCSCSTGRYALELPLVQSSDGGRQELDPLLPQRSLPKSGKAKISSCLVLPNQQRAPRNVPGDGEILWETTSTTGLLVSTAVRSTLKRLSKAIIISPKWYQPSYRNAG